MKNELILEGEPASSGICMGVAYILTEPGLTVPIYSDFPIKVEKEIKLFRRAINKTRIEIRKIRKVHSESIDREPTRIFDAHLLILDDEALLSKTEEKIRKSNKSASRVFSETIDEFIDFFRKHPDKYIRERAVDLKDLKTRIIENMSGHNNSMEIEDIPDDAVIISSSLTPSQTINLKKNKVCGIAIGHGGVTSHALILAKSLGIPAVTGLKSNIDFVENGAPVILDGNEGLLLVNPSRKTVKKYLKKMESFHVFTQDLSAFREEKAITKDGFKIKLTANIDLPEELPSVRNQGAEGIGLYRSEYLYIREGNFPGEEDQYTAFMNAVESVSPNDVIIRLFDLGGDKVSKENPDFNWEEKNPFLGLRGIRYLLSVPEQLHSHLRAILRTSATGKVGITIPMVSRFDEIREVLDMMDEVRKCMSRDGIPFDENMKVGILVETPAAALMAEDFAETVDFLSIGSNDLTMYTLAADRENSSVLNIYQHFDPAVLRLIKIIVDGGHKKNKPVGVCGEMAGDPLMIPFLVGLGVDFLSMTPSVIPEVKKIIRSLDYGKSKKIASELLSMKDYRDVKRTTGRILKNILK